MGTIGIVAISVIAALFLFTLLAGLAALVWLAWQLRRILGESQAKTTAVYAETEALLKGYQAESKSLLESAKTAFASIRNEVRSTLETQRADLGVVLEHHRNQMQQGIDKINAEALQAAAARSIQACIRLEKVAVLLQQMFSDTEARVTNDYAPEEYAPEERFGTPPTGYSVSTTAALDEQSQAEESAATTGS